MNVCHFVRNLQEADIVNRMAVKGPKGIVDLYHSSHGGHLYSYGDQRCDTV